MVPKSKLRMRFRQGHYSASTRKRTIVAGCRNVQQGIEPRSKGAWDSSGDLGGPERALLGRSLGTGFKMDQESGLDFDRRADRERTRLRGMK